MDGEEHDHLGGNGDLDEEDDQCLIIMRLVLLPD